MRQAQNMQDPEFVLEAHRALGNTLILLGEFTSARAHHEQALAHYNLEWHRSPAFVYGDDAGVACHSLTALVLWYLGYPQEAVKSGQKALTLARELAQPSNLAFALCLSATLYQYRQEVPLTKRQADMALALATEQGFPYWAAQAAIMRGWAMAEQGQAEEGISQLCQGLDAWRATRAEQAVSYFLALLGEAYGKAGQTEEGLTIVAEALAFVNTTGEHMHEAELHRLKGQLTLQSQSSPRPVKTSQGKSEITSPQHLAPSTQAEAEACFLKAIDIARQQSAKSLELRAATSLARLWQQQSKKTEARQMLAEIYNWFTEGFDTADLQEAKALLDELS